MNFVNYIQPNTIDEAYKWAKETDAVIAGGMMWLRMQNRTVQNLIDLSKLGLDKIEQSETSLSIGAYVTLRQAETCELLKDYTKGAIEKCFAPIVGVQFRNTATIGGSVFGRFGFSDVTTIFSALGAEVNLASGEVMSMEEFLSKGAPHDILTYVTLPKETPDDVFTISQRNTATDFPVLTITAVRRKNNIRISITPAPLRTTTLDFSIDEIDLIKEKCMKVLNFKSDGLGSEDYRRHLAEVFIKRALLQIGGTKQ